MQEKFVFFKIIRLLFFIPTYTHVYKERGLFDIDYKCRIDI